VLVEVASSAERTGASVDRLAEAVEPLAAVRDAAVVDDTAGRVELWSYREDHTLAINTLGPPHKLDVTLPPAELARFLADVPDRVRAVAPSTAVWLFGHVADGNIHVNVTGLADDDLGSQVDDAVLGLVAERGGSISAEHGIGTAKRAWLHLNRSPAEIDVFRRIKAALDPNGILNPHVLLPDP
jgi:FAD/FMN-containing dehydrogenase